MRLLKSDILYISLHSRYVSYRYLSLYFVFRFIVLVIIIFIATFGEYIVLIATSQQDL